MHVVVTVDAQAEMPHDFNIAALTSSCLELQVTAERPDSWSATFGSLHLSGVVDEIAPSEVAAIAERIGSEAAGRSEAPKSIGSMLPTAVEQWWTTSAASGVSAVFGRAGAEPIKFELGDAPVHAIIGGRTGSGKTQLLHSIINSLAISHSPDELELLLVDMKQGVEFFEYAGAAGEPHLPHALVVATDADAEYALSVLDHLLRDIERRAALFKDAAVTNLAEYRRACPNKRLPRRILIIDEFQNLFLEDNTGDQAWQVLNRIAREGRAYGIHLVLSSQTLGGLQSSNLSLRQATFAQFALRIALMLTPEDSTLVLGDRNTAAAGLKRPGQGIYNSNGGEFAANKTFQAAVAGPEWRRQVRAHLTALRPTTPARSQPMTFRGDERAIWQCGIARRDAPPSNAMRVPFGPPVAISHEVTADLYPDRGRNVVVIGRKEEDALRLLVAMTAATAEQATSLEVVIADLVAGSSPMQNLGAELAELCGARHLRITAFEEYLATLAPMLVGESSAQRLIVILGLHRGRWAPTDSWGDEAAGPFEHLQQILDKGPETGTHVLAWVDEAGSLQDQQMRKFGVRALFHDAEDAAFDLFGRRIRIKENRLAVWDQDQPSLVRKAIPYRWQL